MIVLTVLWTNTARRSHTHTHNTNIKCRYVNIIKHTGEQRMIEENKKEKNKNKIKTKANYPFGHSTERNDYNIWLLLYTFDERTESYCHSARHPLKNYFHTKRVLDGFGLSSVVLWRIGSTALWAASATNVWGHVDRSVYGVKYQHTIADMTWAHPHTLALTRPTNQSTLAALIPFRSRRYCTVQGSQIECFRRA